ncbi:MAG: hypothetical protein M3N48_08410 [Verrucomicrobiota bacterium]|nr:hypothetical protein [Verrucomicrobiota bacterium]
MKKIIIIAVMAGVLGLAPWFASLQAQTSGNNQVLFGLTFYQNQLVTIDTATGQATLVGTVDDNITGYGLAAYQNGLYTYNPNKNEIDQLSMVDGHVVARKPFNATAPKGEGDIVIRSDTGMGFVASALDENGNPTHPFYGFDVRTGTGVKIANTRVALDGLALDQSQTLYAVGQGDNGDSGTNDPAQGDATLYTVNQLTGVLTPVGPLGVPQNSPVAGIAFAQDGTLYAAIDDQLYRLNKATGAATIVNASSPYFGVSSVSGLAVTVGISDFLNISTRANVGTGENVEIVGFMIRPQASSSPSPQPTPSPGPSASPTPAGSPTATPTATVSPSPSASPPPGTKEVMIRAIGPSIKIDGVAVSGTLSDPTLTLYNQAGVPIAFNDNYKDNTAAEQARIAQAGLTPRDDRESVLVRTLPEGVYTAIVRGKGDTSGIAVVEVYDTSAGNGEKLPNISTRSNVGTGDNVTISGMIVGGSLQKRVIFRGIGPSLSSKGVANALQDPFLQLYDANGTSIASNDNWKQQDPATVTDIMGSGLAPSDDRESVIAVTLTTGAYTAVLRGNGSNSTGIGLVEAYDRD